MITRIRSKLLSGEKASNSITGAAFVIAAMGLASRFLGLIRDKILASKFGAGDTLDAYFAAFKIPDLIFNLLILGALSAAFVPVFTSLISKDKEKEAWKLANGVLSIGIIALAAVAVLLFFIAPWMINVLAFGFSQEKQQLVVQLTRVMLISPILLGLSGVMGGILNSYKKFFYYSLAPIFYNVGIIIGAVFFTSWWGTRGLALGVILGAVLHLTVQLPEVLRCGLKFSFSFDWKDPLVKKVGKLMIPRTMGLAVTQVNFLVVTALASTLASGSLTVFNFANNLQSVPLGVVGIPFAIAAFPTLSGLWAQEKKEEFLYNFSNTFRRIMFFIIPFSAMFIVLRAQIVRVILGSGKFDWEDTTLTFQALAIFSMSLFAQSLIPLLTRSFYALHDTKIPFLIGLVSETVNLGLALTLIGRYSLYGLVWAFSVSSIVNMVLLLVILRKKLGSLDEKELIRSVWKIVFATFGLVTVAQVLKEPVSRIVDMDTFLGVFTQLTISGLGGVIAFILLGRLIRIHELEHFIRVIKNRIYKPKVLLDEQRDEIGGI